MGRGSVESRGASRRGGGYDRPRGTGGGFEVYSWVFMRISGLLLIVLALYHLIWWNLVIGVEHLDSQVVIERWRNPLWRLFNVALITFAIVHGMNGARYSIEDYIPRGGWQVAAKVVVYGILAATLAIGVFALLTFDPATLLAGR